MATDYTKWVQLGLTRWDAYVPRKKSKMEIFFQLIVSLGVAALWLVGTLALCTFLYVVWH